MSAYYGLYTIRMRNMYLWDPEENVFRVATRDAVARKIKKKIEDVLCEKGSFVCTIRNKIVIKYYVYYSNYIIKIYDHHRKQYEFVLKRYLLYLI